MKRPAGVAPITVWSEEDEENMKTYPKKKYEQRRIKKFSKGAIGMPLGVQV